VVSRAPLARPPRDARRDWLALVVVGTLAVIVLVILAGMFGGTPTVASGSPSPTSVVIGYHPTPGTSSAPTLPPFSFEPTTAPTPTYTPTPPLPTPAPTPTPSPTPSPTPTPTPTPEPTPLPTQVPVATDPSGPQATVPAVGLVILDPLGGSSTVERVVIVRGLAAPGATITRDVPMWFDEHTVADGAGRWSFVVQLAIGDNAIKFRVGDDLTTEQTLNIHCFAV
jgi:hypothetical protein